MILSNKENHSPCPLCNSGQAEHIGSKPFKNGTDTITLDYLECVTCNLVYADRIPTPEMFSAAYQGHFTARSILRKTLKLIPIITYAWLKKIFRADFGKIRFLDIGSNAGYFTEGARRLGCEAYGLELDEKALEFAKKNYPKCHFSSEPIEKFKGKNIKFDVIYCSEVIEYVVDIHSFTEAMRVVSKDRSILFLTTPDSGHFKVPRKVIEWSEIIPVQHLRLFNTKNIRTLLNKHGFEINASTPMLRANQRHYCSPKK